MLRSILAKRLRPRRREGAARTTLRTAGRPKVRGAIPTVLLIAAGFALAAPPAEANRPVARPSSLAYAFDVTWTALPDLVIARGRIMLEQSATDYTAEVDARARLSFPRIDRRDTLRATGVIEGGARASTEFTRRSVEPDVQATTRVAWGEADPPRVETIYAPPDAAPDREPVDPTRIRDVVDPLTFVLQVFDVVSDSNGESCELATRSWDGARLIEIRMSTDESVPGNRIDCRMSFSNISGLRRDQPFRVDEDETRRILRFRRVGLEWAPEILIIESKFGFFRSRFETRFRPID